MMLQAFPSSNITADSAKVYLFAVEEFSLDALKRACRQIVRGEVTGLKPDFPPSAPKLAQIVKAYQDALTVEHFEAENPFVEAGSDLWRKMELLRGDKSLPRFTRTLPDGRTVTGWNFSGREVTRARKLVLPAPMSAAQVGEVRARLTKSGFLVGDPDGDAEVA